MLSGRRTPRPYWPRRVWWWVGRGLGATILLVLLLGCYLWWSTPLPTPTRLRAQAALGSTRILDRNGELLYAVPDPLSAQRRPVPLAEIPLPLQQAVIAVEDSTFQTNRGIDLRGILRAVWTNLQVGEAVAGGSTLTQQLARNFLLSPELAQQRSLERKLREAVLALKLTAAYPKNEILQLYLNQSYFGGLAYGVEAAAQHVFGKPVRDLDLAECALLAGLPQAPSRYHPLTNPQAAIARQQEVLAAMVRVGYLTDAQAATASSEQLRFGSTANAMLAPHFVHYVLDLLTAELGADAVVRGGLVVTTTLDLHLQTQAQASLARQISLLQTPKDGAPNHQVRNGAVVVLDPSDGAILTMVGSPNFDDTAAQGQVNAALALRQPGSAIKPLTYAAALERGWTAASTIYDVPSAFPTGEGRPYTPENYDRSYHGPLSLREALATSSNVSAVQVLHAIGVPALVEMAERIGITSFSEGSGRFGLALTLGGGEVTPLELTAAYGSFANGGWRLVPYAVMGVGGRGLGVGGWEAQEKVDLIRGGEGPLPNPSPAAAREGLNDDSPSLAAAGEGRSPQRPGRGPSGESLSPQSSILSPTVAYLITDILSDRYARMRAFGTQSALDLDRPAAAKTGTTSDWRDNWTVGYTPDRVVGVWVGNADGQPMEQISGITGAGPVWNEVMLLAHRGLPPRPFARPAEIVEQAVCAEGGMLPGPNCPATRLERFAIGTAPTAPDNTHIRVAIDPALNCRAPANYPQSRVVNQTYRLLPPTAESWMVAANLPRPPHEMCPPLAVEGNAAAGAEASTPIDVGTSSLPVSPSPALLSPVAGAVFSLSPGIPRERQQIELRAQAGGEVAKLTILIDGTPLASHTGPPYRTLWPLAPGSHRAQVVVMDYMGNVTRSEEVMFQVNQ